MSKEYSLDLAFSSAIPIGNQTNDPNMYALGYGWAESEAGHWSELGQKTEKVDKGVPVFFTIFDGAAPSPVVAVTSIVIRFDDDTLTPFSASKNGSQIPNPIVVNEAQIRRPFGTKLTPSVGCNTQGYVWQTDPYYVVFGIEQGATFQFSVQFTVQLADGSAKTFKVDPEMIVGGPGPVK